MIENSLNRSINKVFYQVAKDIYESDMDREAGVGWKPLRPVFLDHGIAPFFLGELLRLIKAASQQNLEDQLIAVLRSKSNINDIHYLWPALGFSPSSLSYEDKLFLISKLIKYSESLPQGDSDPIFDRLEKDHPDVDTGTALREGTKLYIQRLTPLYELLGEDHSQKFDEALREVMRRADQIRDPGAWKENSEDEAIRKLVRNSDFRREKEKGLEEVLRAVPGAPGIIVGVIGENVLVEFGVSSINTSIDGYIIDTDAFKTIDREDFAKHGIVVVHSTRSGSKKLQKGEKVWVDGTSGVVYRT